jgi:hypothetical protein
VVADSGKPGCPKLNGLPPSRTESVILGLAAADVEGYARIPKGRKAGVSDFHEDGAIKRAPPSRMYTATEMTPPWLDAYAVVVGFFEEKKWSPVGNPRWMSAFCKRATIRAQKMCREYLDASIWMEEVSSPDGGVRLRDRFCAKMNSPLKNPVLKKNTRTCFAPGDPLTILTYVVEEVLEDDFLAVAQIGRVTKASSNGVVHAKVLEEIYGGVENGDHKILIYAPDGKPHMSPRKPSKVKLQILGALTTL